MTNSVTSAGDPRPGSIKLPLRLCDESMGVILGADGSDFLTVDIDRARDDVAAAEIARWDVTHHKPHYSAQAAAADHGNAN
ncbi:hypothetical protein [Breoghania sp. L-A4]|uniref:hypothetical protein n=1 Tax=Breoghania sp. L-A4 TaxID=2304600 RepID=UPI000E359EED|nr:hypothetical protein [Breoghania sp. L-A4]AXS39778.1 hypothetical protein D1F64_06580 [Breoghania sp. L-A4]